MFVEITCCDLDTLFCKISDSFMLFRGSGRPRYGLIGIPGLLIFILATYIYYDGIWLLKGNSWKNAHYTGT